MMRAIIEVLIRRAKESSCSETDERLATRRFLSGKNSAGAQSPGSTLYQHRAGDELRDEWVDGCVEVDGSEANLAAGGITQGQRVGVFCVKPNMQWPRKELHRPPAR